MVYACMHLQYIHRDIQSDYECMHIPMKIDPSILSY